MKKQLFKIITAISLACAAFFTCACSSVTFLNFNNNFVGLNVTGNAPSDYTETMTYSVKLENRYENIEKSTLLDNHIEYDYNGEYKMQFSSTGSLPSEVQSSIELPSDARYYKLETKLTLNAFYKYNGQYPDGGIDKDGGKTYVDTINSVVYFLPAGYSFAPIFVKTTQDYTYINFSGQEAQIIRRNTVMTTTYNNDSYTTKLTVDGKDYDNTSEYDYRAVIDNSQLLFAIRCLDIEPEKNYTLYAVSPSYSIPQPLVVQNQKDTTATAVIDGENKSLSVRNLIIYKGDGLNVGTSQYALVSKVNQSNPKALLVEYAAVLVAYETYAPMGALVYRLTSTK